MIFLLRGCGVKGEGGEDVETSFGGKNLVRKSFGNGSKKILLKKIRSEKKFGSKKLAEGGVVGGIKIWWRRKNRFYLE